MDGIIFFFNGECTTGFQESSVRARTSHTNLKPAIYRSRFSSFPQKMISYACPCAVLLDKIRRDRSSHLFVKRLQIFPIYSKH